MTPCARVRRQLSAQLQLSRVLVCTSGSNVIIVYELHFSLSGLAKLIVFSGPEREVLGAPEA